MNMHFSKTLLVAALATLGATAAQAASLSLVSGSVTGSLAVQAGANDQAFVASAGLDDLSGAGYLLGVGGNDASQALAPAGALTHLWSAGASLDTTLNPASAVFQAGSTSVLGVDAAGRFDGSDDRSAVWLEAELAILSTGEADGTAVRVDVVGVADALFGSSGPAVQSVPSFDLVVRNASSQILGSWQGLPAGGSAGFAFSFQSQVGQVLSFSLSHDSSLMADAFDLGSGALHTLDTAALLDGQISVSAVPEPQRYALFIAGLAAIGLLHARNRRGR